MHCATLHGDVLRAYWLALCTLLAASPSSPSSVTALRILWQDMRLQAFIAGRLLLSSLTIALRGCRSLLLSWQQHAGAACRFMAGGAAGALSRASVAPFERLRTMMMADQSNRRIWATMKKMWADGGVRGMFKGNLATMVKVMPQSAVQFAVGPACQSLNEP